MMNKPSVRYWKEGRPVASSVPTASGGPQPLEIERRGNTCGFGYSTIERTTSGLKREPEASPKLITMRSIPRGARSPA